MSYQSKYTLEEQKIIKDINYISNQINNSRTKKTRRKYLRKKDRLIKQLNGKYGSGKIKMKTTKSEAHKCIKQD